MQPLETILVVDDDPRTQAMLGEILTRVGYRVARASSATCALELVAAYRYSGMFIGCILPDGDAIELHRKIRAVDPGLAERSFLMGGPVEASPHSRYCRLNGCGFLPKPFHVTSLADAVRKLRRPAPASGAGRSVPRQSVL